jgi:phage head maturation protease
MSEDEYVDLLKDDDLESEMRAAMSSAEKKKPYGDTQYADPGYQKDNVKRYPLDTEAHCRAAWSYINMSKNAAKYTPEQVASIKSKIKAAAKRLGVQISSESRSAGMDVIEGSGDSLIETRSTAHVADVDYPQRIITVCAVPYDRPTRVIYKREIWNEVFSRSAFNGLDAKKRRIPVTACLDYPLPPLSHEGGELVGKIAETYTDRDEGLIADVKVSRTPLGQSVLELANDDAVSVSVGFMVKAPHYDESLDVRNRTRRINRAFLEHLAFVGEGAYPGAKILAMRSAANLEDESPVSPTPEMDKWLQDPIIQQALSRSRK